MFDKFTVKIHHSSCPILTGLKHKNESIKKGFNLKKNHHSVILSYVSLIVNAFE